MSSCVHIRVNNKTKYTLKSYKNWGVTGTGRVPPISVAAHGAIHIDLETNNRAGIVFLATDALGNEMGFVTLSFNCSNSSANSAEGSPDKAGTFISAGLQAYEEQGAKASFEYNVGEKNLACWHSADSDNGVIACDETRLKKWARVLVLVNNTTSNTLEHVGNWGANWVKAPVSIPAKGRKIFLLNDSDRSGIYYQATNSSKIEVGQVTMSMACPKHSSNLADGSKKTPYVFLDAGLQHYEESGIPASFTYKVGQPNQASWASGASIDESIECKQTGLEASVEAVVINDNSYDSDKSWKVGS